MSLSVITSGTCDSASYCYDTLPVSRRDLYALPRRARTSRERAPHYALASKQTCCHLCPVRRAQKKTATKYGHKVKQIREERRGHFSLAKLHRCALPRCACVAGQACRTRHDTGGPESTSRERRARSKADHSDYDPATWWLNSVTTCQPHDQHWGAPRPTPHKV